MNITGKRILAFFIDLVILSTVGAVVMFAAILLFPQQNISLSAPLFNVVNLLITLLFLFREKLGISIGKRAMKIKTVCADGSEPTLIQHFMRNITTLLWPVEGLLLITGNNRLGDMWAKTTVVSV